MERNWADLPPEIVRLIVKKLPEICDFVRSRAVCKPWRFSSTVSDLPPQFPWIFRTTCVGPDLEFYSIAFNKVYTIRTHCSSGKRIFRSAGGYLLTDQEGNADSFSLLNPLNDSEIPLPVLHDINPNSFPVNFDNYLLVTGYDISFGCKLGDDRWDIIGPGHECQYRSYYLKGLLFRVDYCTWVTKIMDISSRKELYFIQPPKYEKMSKMFFAGSLLVESCGEILAVCFSRKSYSLTDYKFCIHRLEFGNEKGNPCWINIRSIGDRILFLDFHVKTGCGFSLRASDSAGFKENCIYFTSVVEMPDG